ncbi:MULTISPECIES: TOPRIM nucleotidyl transferase/hydrolase domain-containing protein [Pantoea]|uniref:TOPRIM nucleotidyl transferase/hydrolase domain-containing protein n=1 Tax=Pantoea TaxID=53335 RepID=UPI0025CA562D|nr:MULTISPECIES: TOPRIM nucleotidyl transferase/hydrolase domain-containing protein [Pantoea]MDN4129884.1 hypothetical protein [Pantoea ananatis]MDN4153231.1 hypothetical protein [Pantoea ananatis]MDR6299366.1 hypothetical protein [Pantoea dispersa]
MLEFALARRVILFDGDAEFILTEAFYRKLTGRAPEDAGVHIVAMAVHVSASTLSWRVFRTTASLR